MTNYKASAPYLKECLRTHKERTGEKQIPLSKRLGLFSQGALSQAANQTETNGNASLGIPAATVLFNDIGGDLYKYLPYPPAHQMVQKISHDPLGNRYVLCKHTLHLLVVQYQC